MNKIYIILILFIGAFAQKATAQAELNLSSNLQCGTYSYCVDIELKATNGTFSLGTSSLLLKYNSDALTFNSYTAVEFDSASACVGAWSPQQFDLDVEKGEFSLTMKLLNAASACISVDTATKIIGTLCFTIEQQGGNPDINFVANHTHLNRNIPDNGTSTIPINVLDSLGVVGALACDCPSIGGVCDDNNGFTTNDIYDENCNCVGQMLDMDSDGVADGVDPCFDVQYEAEDAYYIGGAVATNHMQYFGTGFVDWQGWQGDTLEFTVQAIDTGIHNIAIRYSNGNTYDRHLQVTIDGNIVNSNLLFPSTDTTWEKWDTVQLSHYFTLGTHSILFTSNPNQEPNIDRITLSHCVGCATTGQWCDDGDSCTVLDIVDVNCNCVGVLLDSDNDGVCDQADICPNGDDNIDTDNDGTPDDCDECNNMLVGTSCDDGNPCTSNDIYDANCNCAGTATGTDSDNDGVCDAFDICAGGDDHLDMDSDNIPDFCDTCDNRMVGMPCDDGDPCTVLDIFKYDCGCAGTPVKVKITGIEEDVTCYNFDDGKITLSIAGSFGDLIYDWNTGDSIADLVDLAPGNYEVIVTDFRTCKDTAAFNIIQPDTLTIDYSIVASADSNGSATLTIAGGIQPYSYNWESGDSTPTITNLIPYTYNVAVTDSNNCVTEIGVDVYPADMCVDTILQAEDGILHLMGKDTWNERWALGDGFIYLKDDTTETATYYIDVPADGFYTIGFRYTDKWATRTAEIIVDGNTEFDAFEFPRTYDWANWQKIEFVQYFTTGQHQLIIAHADHNWGPWIDFISVCNQVVVPISLDANIIDNICYGKNEGEITVLPTGGTRNYTYLWSTGDTTAMIDSLLMGDYYVSVTDEVGQVTIDTFTVGQPTEIAPVFTMIDAKCNGNSNGRATVQVTGGTPNYSYNWSNGQTWKSTYNVPAGIYTLTVTDANSCIKITDVTVIEPDTMEAFFDNTPSSGSDGAIDLTAIGGNGSYTYNWAGSIPTEDRTGLAVGYYKVTITDTLNCKLKTGTNVFPAGVCLDTVIQTENGAYQNLAYHIWYPTATTGRGYIQFSTDSLGEGTYHFDAAQTGYYAIGFRYASKNFDRKATVEIDGIIHDLDFNFPQTTGWTDYQFIDFTKYLTGGTHTIKLRHRQSWGPRIDFIAVCDLKLEGEATHTDITCHGGSTGTASVAVSGGIEPYQYLWSTGDTTAMIANLSVGTYIVSVTDTLNQVFIDTVEVMQAMPVMPVISAVNVDCYGNSSGQAVVNVSGGVPSYTYAWSNNAITDSISNLGIGTYHLIVTDAAGCTGTDSVIITQPALPLDATIGNVTHLSCNGDQTGNAIITTTGGTSNYNYQWSNNGNTPMINNLGAGIYTAIVTDANGCTDNVSVTINEPTALISTITNVQNLACFGDNDGQITTSTTGGTGAYTLLWNNGDTTNNITNLSGGNYILTITDANNCTTIIDSTITEPTALSLQLTETSIDCNGNGNGSIALTTTGGAGNYTYQWNNNQTDSSLNNLQSGTYSVVTTDGNGCIISDSATIIEPTALTFTYSLSASTSADGLIDLTPLGGTPNYSFTWSDNAVSEDRTNLVVGNYYVTITDNNGCNTSERFTIFDANTCIDDVYQAEEALVSGANVVLNDANGALGDGYADFGTATTETLTFTVNPAVDTIYEISLRYTQGTAEKPLEVSIDGNVVYASMLFSKTINWNTWNYISFDQQLTAGTHTIQFKNIAANGPDIDYLSLCTTAPDTSTSIFNPTKDLFQPALYPYPNPATLDVNLDIQLADASEGTLTIFDVNGRMMHQTIIQNNGQNTIKEKINVENYAEGVYFVQLRTALGSIVKKVTVLK